jgi:nucleoid-associated protein YgaU
LWEAYKSDPAWIALKKEIEIMKRITLVLGVVAVMAAMLVALAAPAMAKDNGLDNRSDLIDKAFFVPLAQPVVPPAVSPVLPAIPEAVDTRVVQPGDTLFGIAQEQLGPAAPPEFIAGQVDRIHELNRDRIGDNPHLIFPGQELRLPSHL